MKLRAGGERIVVTGEGNGPVNALDHALRQAIGQAYPEVAKLELIDYKVRILDQGHGTDAITRVLIETSDGESSWVTVGVGANVIEASWGALIDGVTYGLRRHQVDCAGGRYPPGGPGPTAARSSQPASTRRPPCPRCATCCSRISSLQRRQQRGGQDRQVAGDAELGEQVAHVRRGEGVRRVRAADRRGRGLGSARRAAG